MDYSNGRIHSTLRCRTLYGHLKATKQSMRASSFATVPDLFCRDCQRTTCSFPQDHYGLLRGKRKWLRHICADCWVKVRTQALHPEGSKEGPSSTNSGVKKLISSSTLVHHVDFRDEGAFSSDCFVSEVSYHEILGTKFEQFHDSARFPVSTFVDDSRL